MLGFRNELMVALFRFSFRFSLSLLEGLGADSGEMLYADIGVWVCCAGSLALVLDRRLYPWYRLEDGRYVEVAGGLDLNIQF